MTLSLIKKLKQFGKGGAVFFIILGALLAMKGSTKASFFFFAFSAFLFTGGFLMPKVLYPVYIVITKVGHVIGWINTRIILLLIYYVIVTPIGVFMKILGKDNIKKKIKKDLASYWEEKDFVISDIEKLEKQY